MRNRKEEAEIEYYERKSAEYEDEWAVYNNTLYRMCSEMPNHDSLRNVIAKVGIISRAYSSGLERQVRDDNEEGGIYVAAKAFCENQNRIDEMLSGLKQVAGKDDKYDENTIPTILSAHEELLSVLVTVTGNRRPRSFASKYLHFHARGVPIFDSNVRTVLEDWYHQPEIDRLGIALPEARDEGYARYCLRFLLLWNQTADEKVKYGKPATFVSVRKLDYYLQCKYYDEYST
jgi:hypothetical protein